MATPPADSSPTNSPAGGPVLPPTTPTAPAGCLPRGNPAQGRVGCLTNRAPPPGAPPAFLA